MTTSKRRMFNKIVTTLLLIAVITLLFNGVVSVFAIDGTHELAGGSIHAAVKRPLKSISVSKSTATINVGSTTKLTVAYNPTNTTDSKTVTWTTSDKTIATVSGGTVTAKKPGKVTITAKVGKHSAKCVVTVKAPLKSISVNKKTATINVGATTKLTVAYNPTNTTDSKTVTWTTSDKTVATVSGGTVTAKKPGTAKITAKVGKYTAICTVTVKAPLKSISVNKKTATINVGSTTKLTVAYNPTNTTDSKTVTWTTSDKTVATVSGGTVTAKKPGTAKITAKVGNYTAVCTVTVKAPLKSISLNKTTATINVGSTTKLTVSYNPTNTTDSKTITWTTSDKTVATVSGGTITAKNPGKATITAKVGTRTATCTVTVKAPLKEITLDKSFAFMNVGESEAITVNYVPANTTDNKAVTWTSVNSDVAEVINGKIEAKDVGITVLEAKVMNKVYHCVVVVRNVPVPLEELNLSTQKLLLNLGDVHDLAVSYNPVNTTVSRNITWTSEDTRVVTVSNGRVRVVAPGITYVTATMGDKTARCEVIVKGPLKSISLDPASATIHKGKGIFVYVKYDPVNTTDDKTVTWSSSNTSVATVSSVTSGTAVVKGVKAGTATITAKVGDKTATFRVTVDVPLEKVTINNSPKTMNVGSTVTLTTSYLPTDTTDSTKVTWTSSDTNKAVVTNGKVTAKKPGKVVITAKMASLTATCTIDIKSPLKSLTLNKKTTVISAGFTEQLKVTPSPSDTTDAKTVKWSSSNTAIATVTNTGVINAKKPGKVKITATSTVNKNISVSCDVTIVAPYYPRLTAQIANNTYVYVEPQKKAVVSENMNWLINGATVSKLDINGAVIKKGVAKITCKSTYMENDKSKTVTALLSSLTRDSKLDAAAKTKAEAQWKLVKNSKATYLKSGTNNTTGVAKATTIYTSPRFRVNNTSVVKTGKGNGSGAIKLDWTNSKNADASATRPKKSDTQFSKIGVGWYSKDGITCWVILIG